MPNPQNNKTSSSEERVRSDIILLPGRGRGRTVKGNITKAYSQLTPTAVKDRVGELLLMKQEPTIAEPGKHTMDPHPAYFGPPVANDVEKMLLGDDGSTMKGGAEQTRPTIRNYKLFELISLEALQSPNESASGCKQYPTQGPDC